MCLCCIRSVRHGTSCRRPGPLLKRRPHRSVHNGESETSQVPGGPTRLPCPALRPRGETRARHCGTTLAAFHFENSVGLRTRFLSGLHHTAWRHPVYASQPRSPLHHATLGSGWLPTFAGQDCHLPGPIRSFQSYRPLHDFPLLQASPGALSTISTLKRHSTQGLQVSAFRSKPAIGKQRQLRRLIAKRRDGWSPRIGLRVSPIDLLRLAPARGAPTGRRRPPRSAVRSCR